MSENILLKIWKDPVWSKVIAVAIVALAGAFPVSAYWNQIVSVFVDVMIPFILNNWQLETIVVLALVVLFLLFAIVKINATKLEDRNSNEEWFSCLDSTESGKCLFLMWFPLNGLLRSPALNLRNDVIVQIKNSKIIIDLMSRGIIYFNGLSSISISTTFYTFLETQLKETARKATVEERTNMLAIKNGDFADLVWHAAFGVANIV
jgi:hypothetical protein